jgi:rhodanese-related sulfurtransferase
MITLISRDKLMDMQKAGERFTLVDVLPKESFAREHIPGSISIPLAEIGTKAEGLLKKDGTIVVYCASFECQASTRAAEKLVAMGYKKVLDYKGGLKDYKEANELCMSGCCCGGGD